jgi:CheY-like chemotaxis protein
MATVSTFQRLTALVIDDESSVQRTIRRALEPEICNLVEAGDGVSGIQMVSRGAPPIDLVLVDLMLPNLDGLEVIEILSRSIRDYRCSALPDLAPRRRLSLNPP